VRAAGSTFFTPGLIPGRDQSPIGHAAKVTQPGQLVSQSNPLTRHTSVNAQRSGSQIESVLLKQHSEITAGAGKISYIIKEEHSEDDSEPFERLPACTAFAGLRTAPELVTGGFRVESPGPLWCGRDTTVVLLSSRRQNRQHVRC